MTASEWTIPSHIILALDVPRKVKKVVVEVVSESTEPLVCEMVMRRLEEGDKTKAFLVLS